MTNQYRALRQVHIDVNKLIVMDDKKYFALSSNEMKENDFTRMSL